jgi:hypothetical protein
MSDIDDLLTKWWGRVAVFVLAGFFSTMMAQSNHDLLRTFAFLPAFIGGVIGGRWIWRPMK